MVVAAAIAIAGAAFGDASLWLERALVVLVAAAPCAFAISVPVTVVAAVGAATRNGALIKGGAALEALDGIRVAAIDKNGNRPRHRKSVVLGKSVQVRVDRAGRRIDNKRTTQ